MYQSVHSNAQYTTQQLKHVGNMVDPWQYTQNAKNRENKRYIAIYSMYKHATLIPNVQKHVLHMDTPCIKCPIQ